MTVLFALNRHRLIFDLSRSFCCDYNSISMRLAKEGVGRPLVKRPLPPTFRVQVNHNLLIFADDAIVPSQTQPFSPFDVLHLQDGAHSPFNHLRLWTFQNLETAFALQIHHDFFAFRRHWYIPENHAAPLCLLARVSDQAKPERLLVLISYSLLVELEYVPDNLQVPGCPEPVHHSGPVGIRWREKRLISEEVQACGPDFSEPGV